MTRLAEHLDKWAKLADDYEALCKEKDEEIARLRAENEKLREIDSVAPLLAEVDRLRMAAKIQDEVWHQVRLRLTPASGDPYNGLIEAADDLIADRDRQRAEVERLKAQDDVHWKTRRALLADVSARDRVIEAAFKALDAVEDEGAIRGNWASIEARRLRAELEEGK